MKKTPCTESTQAPEAAESLEAPEAAGLPESLEPGDGETEIALPAQEESRERQRRICLQLLERWAPVASFAAAGSKASKAAGKKEPLDAGLKAGAFVLKVLEHLARIDGLEDEKGQHENVLADPLELARRVRTVSPLLIAKLEGRGEKRGG